MLEILIASILVAFCGVAFIRLCVTVRMRVRCAHTQTMLASFAAAISLYRNDWSAIPKGSNADLIRALCVDDRHGPYVVKTRTKLNANGEFLDAWGSACKYVCPLRGDQDRFVLYSYGPNRNDDKGGVDDICTH